MSDFAHSEMTREEQGRALAALRLKMLDYEGNEGFQHWKASWVLPALNEASFKQVIEAVEGFNLTPKVDELAKLFMPQRCLYQDVGFHLRKYRASKKPLSPFARIQQLEEENKGLKAELQALRSVQ